VIPLVHDFAGETVLVVGGGAVGARKARRFAREARVVVLSPAFDDDLLAARAEGDAHGAGREDGEDGEGREGRIDLVRAAPDPDDVAGWVDRTGPALVVAATPDAAVNAAVERAARDRGLLVNRADESGGHDAGSVVVPATVRDGPVTVAVATGGTSPALSRHLRERLEAELDGAGAVAALAGDLRAELREAGLSAADRRAALRAVVRDRAVWEAARAGDADARAEADRAVREAIDR